MHPALEICNEPFNENFVRWAPNNQNYRELARDQASFDKVLDEIFAQFDGLKVLSYQLPEDWLMRLIDRPDVRVLYLRRLNVLQAVVSVLVAEQTKLWHRWDTTSPIAPYYAELKPLDVADVRKRVHHLAEQLRRLDTVIERQADGRAQRLVYEELFFAKPVEQTRAIAALWRFLGLDAINSDRIDYFLRPERSKLNSPTTFRLVPNSDEIEHECGSDMTGHLFESSA